VKGSRLHLHLLAGAVAGALLVAGCGGSGSASKSGASLGLSAGQLSASAQVVRIDIADSGLAFTKTEATATAGRVTLVARNPQSTAHDISIKGNGVDEKGNTVTDGGISRVTATLEAGTYEYYCSVDGHEAAGMKGTLTVQ
jgi:uncharacterized cupredoxin-like copper-binding protein